MIKQKTLKKRTKHTGATSQQKNLSIQFSLDGFSFCITDSESKSVLSYTAYNFEKTLSSPEQLLEKVIAIFADDPDLQTEFDKVYAIHQNNLSTVVPEVLFDRNDLLPYLNYTVKTLQTDFIIFDELPVIQANTVYIPYVNVNNFIFQNFGEFEFQHHSTVLIDKLIASSKDLIQETCFFVHVTASSMDIVVIREEQLLLCNTFDYQTKEDFIYYILFVAEQLQLDPESVPVTFLGNITKEDPRYQITYEFVRTLNFIRSTTRFFEREDDIKNHQTYLLLN